MTYQTLSRTETVLVKTVTVASLVVAELVVPVVWLEAAQEPLERREA